MKKVITAALVVIFVLTLTAVFVPTTAQARWIEPPKAKPDPNWSAGTATDIDLTLNPAPYNWLQLMGKGVVLTAPGELCREFREGKFGWTAFIYQLVGSTWVKLPTTQGWLNGAESVYTACAQAPAAGMYALFAYFIPPMTVEKHSFPSLPLCGGFEVSGDVGNQPFEGGYRGLYINDYPPGADPATWTYKILSFTTSLGEPSPAEITGGITGSFVPLVPRGYVAYPVYNRMISEMAVRIYTPTCYIDWDFIWT